MFRRNSAELNKSRCVQQDGNLYTQRKDKKENTATRLAEYL